MFKHPFEKHITIPPRGSAADQPLLSPFQLSSHPSTPSTLLPPPPRSPAHSQNQTQTQTSNSFSFNHSHPHPQPQPQPQPRSLSPYPYPYPSSSTTGNWNDPPPSWTPQPSPYLTTSPSTPTFPSHVPSQPRTRSTAASNASSTANDIGVLYATANPRVTPRRRVSSMFAGGGTGAGIEEGAAHVHVPVTVLSLPRGVKRSVVVDGEGDGDDDGNIGERWDGDGDGDMDVKGGRVRGSVSGESGGGAVGAGRRGRGRGRGGKWGPGVVRGLLALLILVTLSLLAVWIRGGPLTSLTTSGTQSSGVTWGLNTSGLPVAESVVKFGEKCKAWRPSGGEWDWDWRGVIPGVWSRYFSASRDGGHGHGHGQLVTRTIRLDRHDGLPLETSTGTGSVSRITRGRVFREGGTPVNGEAEAQRATGILGNPSSRSDDREGGSIGHAPRKMDVEEEERRERARAMFGNAEMWRRHAPLPVEDGYYGVSEIGKAEL